MPTHGELGVVLADSDLPQRALQLQDGQGRLMVFKGPGQARHYGLLCPPPQYCSDLKKKNLKMSE